jgi:hypothetical protein
VITHEEQATVSPATMLVVFIIMSALDVPHVPCTMTVPLALVLARKYPAVPVLAAEESEVIALAVAVARPFDTPSTAVGKAVEERVRVESFVPVSLARVLAGGVPVNISITPGAVPSKAVMALRPAIAAAMEITGVAAIVLSYL